MNNKRKILNAQKGFTLIEVLVATVILAMISVFVVSSVLSVVRGSLKAELIKEVKQNGDIALDMITRSVQNSDTVTCSGSKITTDKTVNGDRTVTEFLPVYGTECHIGTKTTITYASGTVSTIPSSGYNAVTSNKISLGYNNLPIPDAAACTSNGLQVTCAADSKSLQISFTLLQKGDSTSVTDKTITNFQTIVNTRN